MSDKRNTRIANSPSRLFICLIIAIFAVAGLVIFLITPWPDEYVAEPFVDQRATTEQPPHPIEGSDALRQTPDEPPSIDLLGLEWKSIEREPQPSAEELRKTLDEFKRAAREE